MVLVFVVVLLLPAAAAGEGRSRWALRARSYESNKAWGSNQLVVVVVVVDAAEGVADNGVEEVAAALLEDGGGGGGNETLVAVGNAAEAVAARVCRLLRGGTPLVCEDAMMRMRNFVSRHW